MYAYRPAKCYIISCLTSFTSSGLLEVKLFIERHILFLPTPRAVTQRGVSFLLYDTNNRHSKHHLLCGVNRHESMLPFYLPCPVSGGVLPPNFLLHPAIRPVNKQVMRMASRWLTTHF